MSKAIVDESAIPFAKAFYRALGYGKDVDTAFQLGINQIGLNRSSGEDVPQIFGNYDFSGLLKGLISGEKQISRRESQVNVLNKSIEQNVKGKDNIIVGEGNVTVNQYFLPEAPKDIKAWKLSYMRNPNFTGRKDLLKTLETNLNQGKITAITQAIHGLGGVGKTQLAVEYIYRYKDNYKVVWWINSEDVANLRTEYAELAVKLGEVDEKAELDTKIKATKEWLGNNDNWLIIFDNVGKPKDLDDYLITKGHSLITSRYSAWGAIADSLKVKVWSPEEATDYLKKRLTKIDGFLYNEDKATELAEEMGYLPLALAQAAAYMESTGCSLGEYIEFFRNEREDLWGSSEPPPHYYKDREKGTIATTWKMALKQIESTKGAKELMNICSYLAPENIPLSLLIDNADLLGEPLASVLGKTNRRNNALRALLSYSLIDRSDLHLSVHRLVQVVVRDRLSVDWLKVSVILLRKAFNFHMNEFETWKASEPLAAHAKQIIEHAEGLKEKDLAWLCNALASYHSNYIVLYDEAEILFKKAIEISKETFGEGNVDYAEHLTGFAILLWGIGRYEEAEPLYKQAIEIGKITIGEEHAQYAIFLNNFALLLKSMGRYEEAEPLYRQAMEIYKITLDEKHPQYVIGLNNLANLLRSMGHYEEAKPLLEKAIEIDKITIGKEHPQYAIRLNNLAELLRNISDYEESEALFRQAIEVYKITIGEKHPQYAISLNNLANLLKDIGRYEEATPLYKQAYSHIHKNIRRRTQ